MSATAKKTTKIKKTIKVQKTGRAIASCDRDFFEGRMYHVEIKYGEFECSLSILTKKHNAREIIESLKTKSLTSILEGNIGYYNSNDMNDQFFSYGRIDYIVKLQKPETQEN